MVRKCCVIRLLRDAGIRSDFKSFEDRLLAQKIIYIAQSLLDIDFGYSFVWHIRGPYSKALSRDLRMYNKLRCECDEASRTSIARTISLINELRSTGKGLSHAVEVLASYLMLLKEVYPKPEDPLKELISRKPYITYEDVEGVLRVARKYAAL